MLTSRKQGMIVPAGGGWIEHDGRGCPFEVGDRVEARKRDGRIVSGQVCACVHAEPPANSRMFNMWRWAINGRPVWLSEGDIVAYRLINCSEGFPVIEVASMVTK